MATFRERWDAQIAEEQAAFELWKREQAETQALAVQAVADGPDVSEHNGDIDWTKVSAGFVFVRTGDGDHQDLIYSNPANLAGSRAEITQVRGANIPLGVYHYCRPASPGNLERSGKVEAGMAVWFAQRVGWGRGDLPMALDIERDSGKDTFNGQPAQKAANHALDWVKGYSALMGHRPIVYTNPSSWDLLRPHLGTGSLEIFRECPLWIAHWQISTPSVPLPWAQWHWWQFRSDAPALPGSQINVVDMNHYSGSIDELNALRIL